MQKNFLLMVVFAFLGFILLFTNNSAFADAHRLGTLYIVVGIIAVIAAAYFLYKVAKQSS